MRSTFCYTNEEGQTIGFRITDNRTLECKLKRCLLAVEEEIPDLIIDRLVDLLSHLEVGSGD